MTKSYIFYKRQLSSHYRSIFIFIWPTCIELVLCNRNLLHLCCLSPNRAKDFSSRSLVIHQTTPVLRLWVEDPHPFHASMEPLENSSRRRHRPRSSDSDTCNSPKGACLVSPPLIPVRSPLAPSYLEECSAESSASRDFCSSRKVYLLNESDQFHYTDKNHVCAINPSYANTWNYEPRTIMVRVRIMDLIQRKNKKKGYRTTARKLGHNHEVIRNRSCWNISRTPVQSLRRCADDGRTIIIYSLRTFD